ncbi:Hypothetical predicted protein, partial [Drosophila guanche]
LLNLGSVFFVCVICFSDPHSADPPSHPCLPRPSAWHRCESLRVRVPGSGPADRRFSSSGCCSVPPWP